MPALFATKEIELDQFPEGLTEEVIIESFGSKVYYKGEEYYENGLVTNVVINAKNEH
jgi:hypothetical protein